MDVDVEKLESELAQCQRMLSERENDVRLLNTRLNEANERLSFQETENTSLRRLVERANIENDQLLEKLGHYEDNKKMLEKELDLLKEALTLSENAMTRDHVIEKLKDVSIETRELIENCDKANEEKEIFESKTKELEEQVDVLKQLKDSLRADNEHLRTELETRNTEIMALQHKLEKFNSQSTLLQEKDFWLNDVLRANSELQNIEKQIQTIIVNSRHCELKNRNLEQEVELMKSQNISLRELNAKKDELISKQKADFLEMKTTLDEYCSEILRLKEKLGAISSENIDVVEFMHFKRSLVRFGNLDTMEGLLTKLLVLQEIEQFFENNLCSHVELPSSRENNSNNSIVTDNKQDTISKIKSYLEKALAAIEKLNDKMIRLENEYESKLRNKTSEISSLRDSLSKAVLYNQVLEQTLQQYKDNAQLDKTIGDETDELLIVNETLLDGFDTLKQLYRVSEQANSFLCAKSERLKFLTRLMELYVRRFCEESQASEIAVYKQRVNELFALMRNIFDEVYEDVPSAQKLVEYQKVIDKCEKSLITKDYLKNTVENMSQEVKRLTSKVEHEMAEKMREIESLKGEVDNVKTDNRELVNKIKNCNREIVSLSTENYELNEKLSTLVQIKNKCDNLKQEVEKLKNRVSSEVYVDRPPSENVAENVGNLKEICSSLRTENNEVRCAVEDFLKEHRYALSEARKILRVYAADLTEREENRCSTERMPQQSVDQVHEQTNQGPSGLPETLEKNSSCSQKMLRAGLVSLRNACAVLKKENEDLKASLSTFVKLTSSDVLPGLHSTFTQLLQNIDCSVKRDEDYKNDISASVEKIASISGAMNHSNKSVRSVYEEVANGFSKQLQAVNDEIQVAVISTFENIKSSFTISSDEMIKEMQEMNAELKKRGEAISSLTQSLSEADKENKLVHEQIVSKENEVIELNEKLNQQHQEFESIRNKLESTESLYSVEKKQNAEQIDNLKVELENLHGQIRSKDEIIATLKNDIQKQKDIHDGDISSVGTISKTEEASRLKDVEDTFEERYMKLKIIAVKMKKNLADLNQELKTEKSERTTLQNKLAAVAQQAKISQALQEECDKLNDDLELKVNEIKELKKIIQASDVGGDELKHQISDLRKQLETSEQNVLALQSEKSEFEMKIKASSDQLEALNRERLAEEIVKKEKDKEIQQLKQTLKELEEAKAKVQNELDKALKEIRKQGALTLEMLDFEKTISDLRSDVESKEMLTKEMRATLASVTNENKSLAETMKQLEEQVSSYKENNILADNQIATLNRTICELENNLKEKEARLKQVMKQLENEKSTNETLVLQLTNVMSEMSSLKNSFSDKNASMVEQLQSAQSKVIFLQDVHAKKENEFIQLQEEYDSYKARAHNLLQKMKNENSAKSNEQKLRKEIDALAQTAKEMKKRLDQTTSELNDQKAQFELLETAKQKLQVRVKELMTSLSEKVEEVNAVRSEFKVHKLNSDTLVSCYKSEIESLKASLEETKIELEKMLVKTENPPVNHSETTTTTITDVVERTKTPNSENGTLYNSSNGSHDSELEHIDEAKTFNRRQKHSLVPLDKLLEPPKKESVAEVLCNGNDAELRSNIKTLEEQVTYLTRILNESEMNAARNEQQVSLLKEEIRRLQRMFDREPHVRNTEYLKNVLIKFVTLPAGDEKSQLVPVLETILKLTPNEKLELAGVAKGQKLDQKPSVAGWTSYLGW